MTEKQERWQKRNRILWRLKGISIPTYGTSILTATEIEKLSQAFSLIREVVKDSTESSRELGFNAIERDVRFVASLCIKMACVKSVIL